MSLKTDSPTVVQFFTDARERYNIMLKRKRGDLPPWSNDRVFNRIFLCNVFREDDKTTVWFRENVRDQFADIPLEVFAATVLFRWFNRISTGEYIFKETSTFANWLVRLRRGDDPNEIGAWLGEQMASAPQPMFTGAFMIALGGGIPKHIAVGRAATNVVKDFINEPKKFSTIREWSSWLEDFNGLGGFMAYEIASDLRWTCLARDCTDIMTWANVGPGCARGLARIYNDNASESRIFINDRNRAIDAMRWLLSLSKDPFHWNQKWKPWDMRAVEHWLSQYDAIMRYRRDEGHIRRWFDPMTKSPHAGVRTGEANAA